MTARRPPPAGTIALTVTASFLAAHHAGGLAPAIAATHGYALAFTGSAALLGLGVILAVVLLPSRRRLTELRNAAAPAAATQAPAPQPERHAIPVALVGCSPVMVPVSGSPDRPARSRRHVLSDEEDSGLGDVADPAGARSGAKRALVVAVTFSAQLMTGGL